MAWRADSVCNCVSPGSAAPAFWSVSIGGVGLLVRYDRRTQDYMMFAVGPRGTFNVLIRKDHKVGVAAAGTHDAIKTGEANRLLVKTLGSTLVFEVNGREVSRMPGEETPGRLVGIGAFGRGTFNFDEVRIAPPGVEMSPKP